MTQDDLTEEEFLKTYDPTRYARPSIATDAVVFSYFDKRLHILLICRKNHPYRGHWAFPGGFVEVYEDPDEAIARELKEETGIEVEEMFQLGAFGRPDRDPRYHVISIAHIAVVQPELHDPRAEDDALEVEWHPVQQVPPLAFDHAAILGTAVGRLRREIARLSFALKFFGPRFTGADFLGLYEEILGEKLDGAKFLRRLNRVCLKRPALTRLVRIGRTKLRQFEATHGAWWL